MAETTAITWATATWNPWMGCHKVSKACAHCYIYRDMAHYGRNPNTVVRAAPATFGNPLKWTQNGKVAPGARIFTCSWSDFFIAEADPWRAEAWTIIRQTPQFWYLVLTKRIERVAECLSPDWGNGYPNVALGVTVENERHLGRVEALAQIPAVVKFTSEEPSLGPVALDELNRGLHWRITGGESGAGCRTSEIDSFRLTRDECARYGVAYFHKQNGGRRKADGVWGGASYDDRTYAELPQALRGLPVWPDREEH